MTHVHQADFLANFTVAHAAKAVGSKRPFFISVTPVMPHWGTCYGPGPASVYPPYDPHWEWTLPGGLSMYTPYLCWLPRTPLCKAICPCRKVERKRNNFVLSHRALSSPSDF